MPGLNGIAYQIGNWTNLKPELPGILKEFAKAAIRTDPNDIIQWQSNKKKTSVVVIPFRFPFRVQQRRWENGRLLFQKLFHFSGSTSFDVSLTALVRVGKWKGGWMQDGNSCMSRDYFRALSRGSAPLDKDRWEEVVSLDNHSGITVGLLRLLHKQLGCSGDVNLGDVSQLWTSLGLERHRLDDLLELVSIATTTPPSTKDEEGGQDLETEENVGACGDGKAETGGAKETRSYDPATIVDWNKLLALAAGQLGDSLGETMEKLCTILTTDDDGGSSLPVDTFIEMYTYLANIDGDIAQEEIEAVVEYAGRVAQLQDGYVNRFNLKSPLCPALH
uniref:Uncharacterized protein n=1 Tax=Daphnia galeata TaxID=27404 RepID=A0A8J2RE44_9CRUS|nr:unnamed protein product [Daphnia galeata]